ncbi:MAG: RNA methyltransferase [Clostridium sp.]|nr:RNA methyltransferase [Clostridium sp.]
MITSVSNKKVKELVELSAKPKARAEADVFLAEGRKLFMEAPADRIAEVYVEEACYRGADGAMREKLEALSFEIVSSEVFRKISDTKTPQGILSVVRQSHYQLHMLLKETGGETPLFLVLERIQDPGNLGTMFRTAEGAGVTGVILTRDTADLYSPKTIRSTMGSVYRVPFVVAEDLAEALGELAAAGVHTYAACPAEGAYVYDTPDYREPCAFLIGNEGNGLREETVKCAQSCITIPMAGQVESLNAAMAAGILLYEAARQRRGVRMR